MWRRNTMMTTLKHKQPPLLEDLRNHSQEQILELRTLLSMGAPWRAEARRPGFFEVDGDANVFYIFKYPSGTKVLLLGVWDRERDAVAELVACAGNAACSTRPNSINQKKASRQNRDAFYFSW